MRSPISCGRTRESKPTSQPAADAYAEIKLSRERQGLRLDENDLCIAAPASALGATLVTRDSDLGTVASLMTVDWTV